MNGVRPSCSLSRWRERAGVRVAAKRDWYGAPTLTPTLSQREREESE